MKQLYAHKGAPGPLNTQSCCITLFRHPSPGVSGSRIACLFLLVVLLWAWAARPAQAQYVYARFNTPNLTLSEAQHATNPSYAQLTHIGASGGTSASILEVNSGFNNHMVQLNRGATGIAALGHNANFDPIDATSLFVQFRVDFSNNTTTTTEAVIFRLGGDFTNTNTDEPDAKTTFKLGFNFTGTSGQFQVRDMTGATNSSTFTGPALITIALNRTAGALTYMNGANASTTVAANRADVYVNGTLVFDDIALHNAAQVVQDLKLAFVDGTGTLLFDDLVVAPWQSSTRQISGPIGTSASAQVDMPVLALCFIKVGSGTVNVTQINANTNPTSTPATTINNAGFYFTAGDEAYQPVNLFGSKLTNPNGPFNRTATRAIDLPGPYFFWLTYTIRAGAPAGSIIDGQITSLVVNANTYNVINPAPSGSRTITTTGLSGTYTVGLGADFPSLGGRGGAFATLNLAGMSGNVALSITGSSMETTAHPLNDVTGSDGRSLSIAPGHNYRMVLTGRVHFSGMDSINIDGRWAGAGRFLIFRNGGGAAALTINNDVEGLRAQHVFFENLQNNTIKNSQVFIGTAATGGTGNKRIMIDSCVFRPRSNVFNPKFVVVSAGGGFSADAATRAFASEGTITAGMTNKNITVQNCEFVNFYHKSGTSSTSVFHVRQGTEGLVLQGCSFYQTHEYRGSAANTSYMTVVNIEANAVSNVKVLNNYFGGTAPLCGGNRWLLHNPNGNRCRVMWVRNASNGLVLTGNTFANQEMRFYRTTSACSNEDSYRGMNLGGNNLTITNNRFGSMTDDSSIVIKQMTKNILCMTTVTAIDMSGSGLVAGNQFGGFTFAYDEPNSPYGFRFAGIRINGTSAPSLLVRDNRIGGAPTNSIWFQGADSAMINRAEGIYVAGSSTTLTLLRDTVQHILVQTGGASQLVFGIASDANGPQTIRKNVVHTLHMPSTNPAAINAFCYGITYNGAGTNVTIDSNTVYNIHAGAPNTNLSGVAAGIAVANLSCTVSVLQNTVHGIQATNTASLGISAHGLSLGGGNVTAQYNIIYDIRNQGTGTTLAAAANASGIAVGMLGSTGMNIVGNMISLGLNPISGAPNPENTQYIGIWNPIHNMIGQLNIYFNSVYIGGQYSGINPQPSYGLLRGDNTGGPVATPVQILNNLLYNQRIGTGTHFAIGNRVTPLNWSTPIACNGAPSPDYNGYFVVGPAPHNIGQWLGTAMAINPWHLASAADSNSINLTQQLLALSTMPFADPKTADLHVNVSVQNTNSRTLPLAGYTTDIDGDFRRSPDIGADEDSSPTTFVGLSTLDPTDWHDAANWDKNMVPNCADIVVIPSGFNLNVYANRVANYYQLTLASGSSITLQNSTVTLQGCWLNNAADHLGTFTNNGTLTLNGGTFNVSGHFANNGTLNSGSGAMLRMNNDTILNGESCLVNFIASYDVTTPISNLTGNQDFNIHNLSILNNGQTSITGNQTVTVGFAATNTGNLEINGTGFLAINTTGPTYINRLILHGYLNQLTSSTGRLRGTQYADLEIYGENVLGTVRFTPGFENLRNLITDRTSGITNLVLDNPLNVHNQLQLTEGLFVFSLAGINYARDMIYVRNNDPVNSVVGGGPTSYIANGGLQRDIQTGALTYQFFVGSASNYHGATVSFNANPSTTRLLGIFKPTAPPGSFPMFDEMFGGLNYVFTDLCTAGYWTIDANTSVGVDYNVSMVGTGLACAGLGYTLVKSPTGAGAWDSTGTIASIGLGSLVRTGYTSFSDFGVANATTVLPVELLGLDATPVGRNIRLDWTTLTETANERFDIEWSHNDLAHFAPVGSVPGAGNSQTPLQYQFMHRNLPGGQHYYRLRQWDFDGKSTLSSVVSATLMGQPVSIGPNPVQGGQMTVHANPGDVYTLTVYNNLGQLVLKAEVAAADNGTAQVDVATLPAGTYSAVFVGMGGTQSMHFTKLAH